MAKKRVYQHSNPPPKDAPAKPIQPLETPPAAPKYLGPIGRDYWERIVPLLVQARTVTTLDLEPLSALCDWWEVYRTQVDYLRRNPDRIIDVDDKGRRAKSPEACLRDQAYAQCLRLWPKFGVSPESAKKLKKIAKQAGGAEEDAQADALAQFAREKYEAA